MRIFSLLTLALVVGSLSLVGCTSPDSDGDGWSDRQERIEGTDHHDPDDHPYEGGWGHDDCRDTIKPTGLEVGDIAYDFSLEDQFGDFVRLHSFCGRVVFVDHSAFT